MNDIFTTGADANGDPGMDFFTAANPVTGDDFVLTVENARQEGTILASNDSNYYRMDAFNWAVNQTIYKDQTKLVVSYAEDIAQGEKSIVLIHDGVRPLINEKTITDNIESVRKHGSSITCVKVKETVLVVAEDNSIGDIPSREDTRLARAPQSFYLDEIIGAHRKAMAENKYDFIDSCSMMQYYGKKLYLIEGPQENIKITTPDDFYTMRALLDAKEEAQIYGLGD